MDKNKILDDKNLERMNLIKSIDIYSMVDREFDKKRKISRTKNIIFISITTLIVLCISVLLVAFIAKNIAIKNSYWILKLIAIYYCISTWIAMLIVIPLINKKKSVSE